MTAEINIVIKDYFKKNKIKLQKVAEHLDMSQSNLTERLSSSRSITLEESFNLYKIYGDSFALAVMKHYNSRMLCLEKIEELIAYYNELQELFSKVESKNEKVLEILNDIESEVLSFSDISVAKITKK
jgi:transcriptional regulator with XRE-family HTH domain